MEGEVVGFEITELRLGLPGSRAAEPATPTKKRSFAESCDLGEVEEEEASTDGMAKKVVVGWPPICTYRKNSFKSGKVIESKVFVKVSMDGAPFLRKVHLKAHKGYSDLSRVLVAMFSNLLLGDGCSNSEYITIYEDNDGDWMLVGDVPWEMFVDSCKRLRIMKRTEAINISTGFGKKITDSKSTSSSSRSEN